MTVFVFIVLALATYRLTIMLSEESGPGDVFGRLRSLLGVKYDEHSRRYGTNVIAQAVVCFYCLSVWIALACWIVWIVGGLVILYPIALSGLAVFMKKWGG